MYYSLIYTILHFNLTELTKNKSWKTLEGFEFSAQCMDLKWNLNILNQNYNSKFNSSKYSNEIPFSIAFLILVVCLLFLLLIIR